MLPHWNPPPQLVHATVLEVGCEEGLELAIGLAARVHAETSRVTITMKVAARLVTLGVYRAFATLGSATGGEATMKTVSETATRASRYAAQFEAAQDEFIRLVESLSDEHWRKVGKNFPERVNDEDEGRPVGVIADHVAQTQPFIVERIQSMLAGEIPRPVDFRVFNARHAAEHAGVKQSDVVARLRENKSPIAAAVRSIPDSELDTMRETPVGNMSVAQRLERVLIGHIKAHEGSIRAAIS